MWAVVEQIFSFTDAHTADWYCFAIGYSTCIVLFACEELIAKMTVYLEKKGHPWGKLAWENSIFCLTTFTLVFIWRGVWHLNVYYTISDPFVGGWMCLAIGTVLLMALQLFSFVGFTGCAVDGTATGRDAIYPTQYLRAYLLPKLIKIRVSSLHLLLLFSNASHCS